MNEQNRPEVTPEQMERLHREMAYLRQVVMGSDMRPEMDDLLAKHFRLQQKVGMLLIQLSQSLTEEEYAKVEDKFEAILAVLQEIMPHAAQFQRIRDRLPDRNDFLLATVDTPPGMM